MNNIKRFGFILGIAALAISVILFGAWAFRHESQGHLVWDAPIVKKSIHTFAYKVYGNSTLENGRYFLSKMVFRNTGSKPVGDFSVSYRVDGYLDWTTPDTLPQVPPGHTVIKCFYPQFPMKVTEIKNKTPSALEIRVRWNEGGTQKEQVVHEDFSFRGVNEIEYTDLPDSEIVSWRDMNTNCNLLAAMVTPNDPVVEEYASAITNKIGGALGGAGGDQEKIEMMNALYNYMLITGMCYAGGLGIAEKIGDTTTTVQTVRLPRDVIMTNNGLCLELTLLWASVLQHMGIKSYVFIIPHHAFIVVPTQRLFNGIPFLPIECTAITPKAVQQQNQVSFEKAYSMALGEFKDAYQAGKFISINASSLQSQGIQPPELPPINSDEVKRILASRWPQQQMKGQPVRR